LRVRIKALIQVLQALSYIALGDLESYQEAVAILVQATEDPEWGASNDNTGQEVLYLFLGNALLSSATLGGSYSPQRMELLERSEQAYARAPSS
jgi:hypothetical protein